MNDGLLIGQQKNFNLKILLLHRDCSTELFYSNAEPFPACRFF
jgi:hypothetical protein